MTARAMAYAFFFLISHFLKIFSTLFINKVGIPLGLNEPKTKIISYIETAIIGFDGYVYCIPVFDKDIQVFTEFI